MEMWKPSKWNRLGLCKWKIKLNDSCNIKLKKDSSRNSLLHWCLSHNQVMFWWFYFESLKTCWPKFLIGYKPDIPCSSADTTYELGVNIWRPHNDTNWFPNINSHLSSALKTCVCKSARDCPRDGQSMSCVRMTRTQSVRSLTRCSMAALKCANYDLEIIYDGPCLSWWTLPLHSPCVFT